MPELWSCMGLVLGVALLMWIINELGERSSRRFMRRWQDPFDD